MKSQLILGPNEVHLSSGADSFEGTVGSAFGNRRLILGCPALLVPNWAFAVDPVTLTVGAAVIQFVIQELLAWSRDDRQLNMRKQLTGAELRMKMAEFMMARDKVAEGVAYYNGALASMGLSDDFDNAGTQVWLKNGRTACQRGHEGGFLTPGEIARLRDYPGSAERLPVPVQGGYEALDNARSNRLKEKLVEGIGVRDVEDFERQYALIGSRSFSTAQRSGDRGPNLEMVSAANRNVLIEREGTRFRPVETFMIAKSNRD